MRAQEFSPRNNPAPVYYFAYGMLTDPANMPGCHAVGAARLPNHRLEFHQYADVVSHAGSEVRGVLWCLPDGTLSQLDRIEGVPHLYNRKMLPVMAQGQRYEAYVYTMTPRTRQTVRRREPSLGYLQTLARGYMKFGLPDSQIRSALRRLKNPESELDEAKMNPTAFASSAQEAAERGVMVGYEFEVLVPKDSITAWQNPTPTTEPNLGQLLGDQTVQDVLNIIAIQIPSDSFNGRTNIFKTSDGKYPLQEYVTHVKNDPKLIKDSIKIIKKNLIDAVFSDTPKGIKIRNDFISKFKVIVGYDLTQDSDRYPDNFLDNVKKIRHEFYINNSSPEDQPFRIMAEQQSELLNAWKDLSNTKAAKKFSDWVKNTYGTNILRDLLATRVWKLVKNQGWNRSAAQSKRQLISWLDPSYVNPDNQPRGDLYRQGAEMINDTMSPTFGTMTVFNRYHESTKALDRWYIEPDGSLTPKPGDTSCEIVGPPTPAEKAMTDLRSFYSLANSLKLYTNNSTGLHVNVSIPDSLDVLKLAVFLGDRYVLQSFGRENNRFAQSVLAHLKGANFKEVDFDQLKKAMDKLVIQVSGNHFASINWNGKYVSFRQAGGDYLNNPQMIENTVGRFIRAMVIASNPAAYRDEYIKKLTAMAPQPQGQANQVDTRITARTTGIWIAEIDAVIIRELRPGDNIVKILKKIARKRHRNEGNKIMVIPNSAQAKSALLGAKGLRATTLEQLRNLPADKFFHVIIAGKNIPQTASETMLAFGIYDSDNNKIAIGVDERRLLKPGDPNFAKALKILTTGTPL